jgi:hypothetical protein
LLAANFTSFNVFLLTDPESDRFDQVAFIGIRKKMAGEAATRPTPVVYRGLPLDQLDDLAAGSSAWKKVEACLLPKARDGRSRPIPPLHGGHVGLLCTAGLLNGVFAQGVDRHIARWRSVKHVTTLLE